MRFLISLVLLAGFAAVMVGADESSAVVGKLTLNHTGTASTDTQDFVVQQVKSHEYKSANLEEIAERVRFAFQQVGYFKVIVHDPVFTVVNKEAHPEVVDVNVNVDEGQIYRLKDITFGSTGVFTPPELRSQFPIADGDVFDRTKISQGLEGIRDLYVTKGYAKFTAVPETQVDESQHTVALVVQLDSGARGGDSNR
jgi:outer membrane protein insertion porin family